MARIAPPDRADLPAAELADYDRVVSRQAKLWEGAHTSSNEYFGALLNSPPLDSTCTCPGSQVASLTASINGARSPARSSATRSARPPR